MIIRARPKYFAIGQMNYASERLQSPNDELYFNHGRSALKFFLEIYSEFKKKQLTIFMQAFNCRTVIEAALQTGCKVVLADIKLEDFSIDFDELRRIPIKPDILLLTHYQGIPNLQYDKLAHFCSENDTLLLDDLAQTEGSKVQGTCVGALSDIQLKSYGFDKPFTCWGGGSINLRNLRNRNLKEMLIQAYTALPMESANKTGLDFKALSFVYEHCDEHRYKDWLNCFDVLKKLFKIGCTQNIIFRICKRLSTYKFFWFPIMLIFKAMELNKRIVIRRLRFEKVALIERQKAAYIYDNSEVGALELIIASDGIFIENNPKIEIHWNRYSILDKKGSLKKKLIRHGIEVGNFNWNKTLAELYQRKKDVTIFGKCYKSAFASEHVINIPVWSDVFRKMRNSLDGFDPLN